MNSTDDKIVQVPYVPEHSNEFSALAYVKPISTNRGQGFAVCAADGTQLAIFADQDVAMSAARQHDLEPVLIH
jgi:hypothetical protein